MLCMIQGVKVTFVDTFGGIGGFHLAIRSACASRGLVAECVKAVEFDAAACKTYEANHGINPNGDMTKIAPEDFPDHDLLTGGFPCQAFSRNGRVYNFANRTDGKDLSEDDRSQLCFKLFDILKIKRPRFFIFENVKEILTIKNKDGSMFIETILSNIDDCGYDVVYKVMNSVDFGLPQQRKRTYFVGTRKDLWLKGKYAFPTGSPLDVCVGNILEEDVPSSYLLSNLWKNRLIGQESVSPRQAVSKMLSCGRKKYADALERFLDTSATDSITRLQALEIAFHCGEWTAPTKRTNTIHPIAIIYGDTPSGLPRQQDKLYSILGISPTIATFSTPSFDAPGGWRVLTPRECARLQGFPNEFKLHENKARAYKQIGNAVSVNVAKAVVGALFDMVQGVNHEKEY